MFLHSLLLLQAPKGQASLGYQVAHTAVEGSVVAAAAVVEGRAAAAAAAVEGSAAAAAVEGSAAAAAAAAAVEGSDAALVAVQMTSCYLGGDMKLELAR